MCGAPSLVKHPVVLDRTQLTAQRLQVVQALRCAVGRFGAPVRHRGYGKTTCPLARQLKIGVQTATVSIPVSLIRLYEYGVSRYLVVLYDRYGGGAGQAFIFFQRPQ